MGLEIIIEELRAGLTGNVVEDMAYLRKKNMEYCKHQYAKEIGNIIGQMTLEVLSNKDKLPDDEMKQLVIKINGIYEDGIRLVNDGKIVEAREVLKEAIKLIPDKDKAGTTHFSFASALELWMYMMVFNVQIQINQTETDNSSIYKLYGYTEAQCNNVLKAKEALAESLKWNPVNVGSLLELAEIHRIEWKYQEFVNIIKNSLMLSLNSSDISRCYYSLAKYYSDIKDFKTSVCLYYVSYSFNENQIILDELRNLKENEGIDIEPPSLEDTQIIISNKGIQLGASEYAVNSTELLAAEAKKNNELAIYKYCKDVFKDLTGNELK